LADNVVIICSIENLDPMGIHTGDSLLSPQHKRLPIRNINGCGMRHKDYPRIGVETGGSNIQFAVNPVNGELSLK